MRLRTDPVRVTPFSIATTVRPMGDGSFTGELAADWTIGGKPHGGYLLALMTRTALSAVDPGGANGLDPLSVSADFLHTPELGPVLVRTSVAKAGRTVTVVQAELLQRGRTCVHAMITVGRLPDAVPAWSDLPDLPADPPARAIDVGATDAAKSFRMAKACQVMLDPEGAGFLSGHTGDPLRLRLWVRPRDSQPDPLFALVAGDISMPVTFNLGRLSWSPTVQLTALLRARPSAGWLRLQVDSRAVLGQWFDEDATVIDSSGKLVCQARQLALTSAG
ncbi:thioesterase family protein [Allokutzneria albata]|uniref:Thioesterase-like superfamily protein n=1 Tax=Allokutzneria albata TaxID=211114 RepID=A0A1G9Z7Q3_ALLAB|nr:thioesterase family protein [Allokutzneria albata]SDN16596.1 Thioesterase-like superfamily protein [Allokutzneria albata]